MTDDDPVSAALVFELTTKLRVERARAEAAEARLAEAVEVLKGTVAAIEWWEEQHWCCRGATDEALDAARAVVAQMDPASGAPRDG
jgi:hypothetical protein